MFRVAVSLAAAAAIIAAAPLHAQSQWLGPGDERTIWLETLHPEFEEEDVGFASFAWQIGGRAPLSERLSIVAEVPFAHADVDLDESDDTDGIGFGNPYLGIEYIARNGRTRAEFGARAPLAPDDNLGVVVGVSSDVVDRFEAFAPDLLPVILGISHSSPIGESGWAMRYRGGGSFLIPVDGGDVDVYALYGVQAWYERDWTFGAGLTGRAILTEDIEDFGELTLDQIGMAFGYDFGGARPMVEVRVPLDENLRDVVPYTIGIGVVVRP